jgi:hypothetical protein
VRRRPSLGTRNHHRLLNVFPWDMLKRAPISTILSEMLHAAGAEPLTLDWLFRRMGERSFGLVLLLLSVFGMLPGVSAFVAVLLMVPRSRCFSHVLDLYFRDVYVAVASRRAISRPCCAMSSRHYVGWSQVASATDRIVRCDGTRLRWQGWQYVRQGRILLRDFPGGCGFGNPVARSAEARKVGHVG